MVLQVLLPAFFRECTMKQSDVALPLYRGVTNCPLKLSDFFILRFMICADRSDLWCALPYHVYFKGCQPGFVPG